MHYNVTTFLSDNIFSSVFLLIAFSMRYIVKLEDIVCWVLFFIKQHDMQCFGIAEHDRAYRAEKQFVGVVEKSCYTANSLCNVVTVTT